ncbi:replication initiation regulator SeqA [Psychromonas aquatilis]|uniref:Negative modulator of initiation of replication n=1 Tax=Psychromonas aquatilis TaxID=2005072 RepID=A0ABU9GRV5_9GAMM
MKTIEIEDDLYKYILNNIEAFGETPSQILRRLLSLPSTQNNNEAPQSDKVEVIRDEANKSDNTAENKKVETSNTIDSPDNVHKSISELFADPEFSAEPIITNKFMMMLTTMYFEKKEAFIEAAEITKGRTRAYLGTNLEELLNSDNEEELAQFKASKPRNIPQTPFWVITNANTGRKRIILTQMMASMAYPHHLIARIKEEI